MSKTPRTDAEALRIINIDTPNRERVDDYHDMFVFARGLERELAAAVKLNEEFWPSTLATRDELRVTKEQLAASQAQINAMKCCENCEYEKERCRTYPDGDSIIPEHCYSCVRSSKWKMKGR